jgi:hypothetical protein
MYDKHVFHLHTMAFSPSTLMWHMVSDALCHLPHQRPCCKAMGPLNAHVHLMLSVLGVAVVNGSVPHPVMQYWHWRLFLWSTG